MKTDEESREMENSCIKKKKKKSWKSSKEKNRMESLLGQTSFWESMPALKKPLLFISTFIRKK